jgi:ubiquinone/menaquinone biosynthesis C-methylase UbiE
VNHADHVRLIEKAIPRNSGGMWADFGSGTGAFTLALRDLAGKNVEVHSIDTAERSLTEQKDQFEELFPGTNIHYHTADFTKPLNLPKLDGFIAANSIHFHKDTAHVLRSLAQYLKPGGKVIIIEYNVDSGNTWVPYPFSFPSLQSITKEAALSEPKLLHTVPSSFLNEIYSALSYKTE